MRIFALATAALLLAAPLAQAEPAPPPSSSPALQKRLASYDAKAVAAARHYYQQPAVKAGLVAVMDNMNKIIAQQVGRNNPSVSPQQLALVAKATSDALRERMDLLIEMSMVNALDVFTTDELVTLDAFYSSPTGSAILKKMPQLSAAAPAMVRAFMPDYLADVKARMKASGAEVKL